MRAITYSEYGAPDDVLALQEIDAPDAGDSEVLVRVRAASLNPYDWHFMRGLPYVVRALKGPLKPWKETVLGSDVAGEVVSVGVSATRLHPGDAVFVEVGTGGCADIVAVAGDQPALKPANLTFEQAATVPMAGMTALVGLRDKGKVQPGESVLINGASGGVGTFAVQIAKALGAEVTGVCSSANVDLVRSIGADHVFDYAQEDFTESGERYDYILDTVGNRSMSACRKVLTPEGRLGAVGGGGGRWFGPKGHQLRAAGTSLVASQSMFPANDNPNKDLGFLRQLIEAGQVTPVINRTYSLDEAPEAMAYLEQGHVRGKIAIAVSQPDG